MSAETDKSTLYSQLRDFFGQKAEETDEGADDEPSTEQKQNPDDDDVVGDLIAALAEQLDVQPQDVRDQLDQLADDDDDDEDDEEEEEEEEEMKTEDDDADGDNVLNFDFSEKLAEHGVVTEDDLDEKLEGHRETIVEEVGEKLAEANEEAIGELAQKMQSGTTPTPAGGSFQDEQDFESALREAAEGDGW